MVCPFTNPRDGHLAREKGGVDASRIKTMRRFNGQGRTAQSLAVPAAPAKFLRDAVRVILLNSKDRRMVSRLTTTMIKVIQADLTSVRGLRNVIDGEAELLEGFEFNANAPLGTTLYAPFTATANRATGALDVNLPAFVPANLIAAPSGATHFKIVSAGAEVDFTNETFVTDTQETGILPWDQAATAVINLANAVTANSTHPLFLLLGVQFFQEVNGAKYPLKNGAFNALQIVKVNGV